LLQYFVCKQNVVTNDLICRRLIMEDDQMLESYTVQENQAPVCWADQEYGMPSGAQSVDDKSSRSESIASWTNQENEISNTAQSVDDNSSQSENLQNISNTLQCNDSNESRICEEGEYPLYGRNLMNSAIDKFIARTYTCDYKLPEKDSTYKGRWYNKMVRFHVEYVPASKTLFITMPVQYMGPTNLNDGTSDAEDNDLQIGTMSEDIPQSFKDDHRDGIERVWSGKHQLHLKEIYSSVNYDSGSCYDWTNISPVNVHVTLKEMNADMCCEAYKVFYLPTARYDEGSAAGKENCTYSCGPNTCCTDDYRDQAGPDSVIFSKTTFENGGGQETYAHEFGHQIGLDDEYAIDYHRALIDNGNREISYVYWEKQLKKNGDKPILRVYERTEDVRLYTLPREKFNHEGEDYFAEEMVFDVNGKEKNGFVLKKGNDEVTRPLDEYQSPVPVAATDLDGVLHHAVYFYDEGKWNVELEVTEKAGPREYDLEKFFVNRTNGARINHNGNEYSVGKREDDRGRKFFYLVDSSGEIKGEALDGSYTTHFDMVKEHFGEKYALENATMYNEDELGFQSINFSNETYIMNGGNEVKPHHYLPFLKGMVIAIQKDFGDPESEEAPNMEKDWNIK
jgi:hypothetical protein